MKKKLVSLLICLILVLSFCQTAFAAGSCYCVSSSNTVYRGGSFTVTVGFTGAGNVKSIGLTPSYDTSKLELASSQVLISAFMSDWNGYDAVIGFDKETSPNTNVYSFTFKVKDNASFGSTTISVSPTLKNLSSIVSASAGSVTVNIACSHNYGAWTVSYSPTCTSAGKSTRTCSICGAVEESYPSAYGHSYGNWTETKAPTCTEEGVKTRTCSVCGATDSTSISSLGHELDNPTITKESTCTSHGEATGTCTRCGETATVETPYAEHTWGEWVDTVAATCTENGERVHTCTVCGISAAQASLPLGHDFTNGELIREANIYTQGVYEAICSRCGEEGSIISACSCTDEDTHIYFETQLGVFENGSEIIVEEYDRRTEENTGSVFSQGFDAWVNEIKKLMGKFDEKSDSMSSVAKEYVEYKIEAQVDGESKAINGSVDITIPIPNGYGRNIKVFFIGDNNERTELPVNIDTENNTVTISTEKLGIIAIANMDKPAETNESSPLGIFSFVIEGVLLVLVLLFLILFLTKKDSSKEQKHARKGRKNADEVLEGDAVDKETASNIEDNSADKDIVNNAENEDFNKDAEINVDDNVANKEAVNNNED